MMHAGGEQDRSCLSCGCDDALGDTPTRAVMKPLLTGTFFRPELYHFFPSLDSTNSRAALLAQQGAVEGTVVVADHQTRGRGRLGRCWSSPEGVNLYFSVVLRPDIKPDEAAQLTLVASLAMAQAVVDAGAADVEIKWPNDVLLGGRKLAGVLSEMRTGPNGIHYVIVGVGINIHGHEDLFPVELRDRVVALAGFLRRRVERPLFLANALAHLARGYARFQREGFVSLRKEWLAFSRICGRKVYVNAAGLQASVGMQTPEGEHLTEFSGMALALDAEGFLLVQRPDGVISRVVAGDVRILSED